MSVLNESHNLIPEVTRPSALGMSDPKFDLLDTDYWLPSFVVVSCKQMDVWMDVFFHSWALKTQLKDQHWGWFLLDVSI